MQISARSAVESNHHQEEENETEEISFKTKNNIYHIISMYTTQHIAISCSITKINLCGTVLFEKSFKYKESFGNKKATFHGFFIHPFKMSE